jgi:hypothetical protein
MLVSRIDRRPARRVFPTGAAHNFPLAKIARRLGPPALSRDTGLVRRLPPKNPKSPSTDRTRVASRCKKHEIGGCLRCYAFDSVFGSPRAPCPLSSSFAACPPRSHRLPPSPPPLPPSPFLVLLSRPTLFNARLVHTPECCTWTGRGGGSTGAYCRAPHSDLLALAADASAALACAA